MRKSVLKTLVVALAAVAGYNNHKEEVTLSETVLANVEMLAGDKMVILKNLRIG